MNLRVRPGQKLMFHFKGSPKKIRELVKDLERRGFTVVHQKGLYILSSRTGKDITFRNFDSKARNDFEVVVTKKNKRDSVGSIPQRSLTSAVRIPCKWSIIGESRSDSRAFRKENDCKIAMEEKEASLHYINKLMNKSNVQAPFQRGCIRIAQDIPKLGAKKQYWMAVCLALHSGGCRCDERALLDLIERENKNLYEVVTDNLRRHHFDIEWPSKDQNDERKLSVVLTLFERFCKQVADIDIDRTIYVTKGSRPKYDSYKHSFHVVYKNVTLSNRDEHSIFMKAFKNWIPSQPESKEIDLIANYKVMTKRMYGYAYDHAIYTKNRLMRLPGQTKPEANCSPFVTYNVEDFDCLKESILISGKFAHGATRLKLNEKIKKFERETNYSESHYDHMKNTLNPFREQERKRKRDLKDDAESVLQTLQSPNQSPASWKDIPARRLRHDDFPEYARFVTAVIDVFNPPKQEVIDWMSNTNASRAEEHYDCFKDWLGDGNSNKYGGGYWKLLMKYRIIQDEKARVRNSMNLLFDKPKELPVYIPCANAISAKIEEAIRIETIDIDMHDKGTIDLVTGKMGVGKTRQILNFVTNLTPGTKVIYIVGRIRLANEIVDLFYEHHDDYVKPRREASGSFDPDKVNVDVVVINSVTKHPTDYAVTIIDESVTTINNCEMTDVNAQDICDNLAERISNKNNKVIALDAMFTLPFLMFIRAMALCLNKIDKDPPVPGPDHLVKTIRQTEIYKETLARNIIPLYNDRRFKAEYINNRELHSRKRAARDGGREGFLKTLLQIVIGENKNVCVAVPTKTWADDIAKLFGQVKEILLMTRETSVNFHKVDFTKYNVVVYTSTVSAGHSITVPNHFDSIFLMCASVDREGTWHTPSVDEMIQMSARPRQTISKNIYVGVDVKCEKTPTLKRESSYVIDSNNVAYSIYKSANDVVSNSLALLCREEYLMFVCDWLCNVAYPGSEIKEACEVSNDKLTTIRQSYPENKKPILRAADDQATMKEIIAKLPDNWHHFIDARPVKGRTTHYLYRLNVHMDTITKFAGPKAHHRSIGEGYYQLISV